MAQLSLALLTSNTGADGIAGLTLVQAQPVAQERRSEQRSGGRRAKHPTSAMGDGAIVPSPAGWRQFCTDNPSDPSCKLTAQFAAQQLARPGAPSAT